MPPIVARLDPSLDAILEDARPLRFATADPDQDLPEVVRAGSALRRWGQRLVVVQDDVNALALLDERSGRIDPLVLPPGPDGRRSFGEALGNKALKLDLEACVTLPDGRLIALGSGSKPARERVVEVAPGGTVRVIDAHPLYAALHRVVSFAGAELNLEGAVVIDGALRLFQRGNGAARDGLEPVDATADLELAGFLAWLDGGPVPALARVRQYQLGAAAGVRFGYTDATLLDDGRVAFLAGAEDSPDTYRDGDVVGCRFGLIDGDEVRLTDIRDPDGQPSKLKLEGIELDRREDDGWSFSVVTDMDAPDSPAMLARLRVRDAGARGR